MSYSPAICTPERFPPWTSKKEEDARKKLVFSLLVAGVAAAVAVGAATAGNGKVWAQPPRGNDQGFLLNCGDLTNRLFVGDTCVAAAIRVPPTGEALNNGQFEVTVPPGTTVDSTLREVINFGPNGCGWTGAFSVSGQTITISGVTCPQSSGLVVGLGFSSDVESAIGTYTLSGDYKVDDSKRSSTNVFRYAQDPRRRRRDRRLRLLLVGAI
jgi:hypothetical protein